ncbi:RNA-directed DNA polymerase from mobile element jockey [Trichonephila clavipes]|nr:RNA-directed DNA polymerase from mobile element jockey [Trichonephila clavipes]
MAYLDFEKAEAFKDTLEVTFQENEEPYYDDKIEVENLVDHYFDNFATCTPPLTSTSEVRGIIKKLQNRKAVGPNQIPNIAFKYFTLNALTHLTKLYNQCLIKNHFPTLWKQANVIMLANPNQDRTYPQGYRPISLINATAKIFERIILTRIKSHCKAIDCIPPEQCGFREGHSTLHQLIRVTNIINEDFAHKFYTVGVFLDVERAFDKMWHDGLTKWGVIDPPFQLTLFDDNIQWVSVVKYLGLHIDSRLTFKKHIDHLAEKFWGRISLAISLIGRRSPLSLENKVILYKQILRPVITYGSPVWGAAAATHMKKIQMGDKIIRTPVKEEKSFINRELDPPLTELQIVCDVGWTYRDHEQLVMEYEAILRGERSLMPKS